MRSKDLTVDVIHHLSQMVLFAYLPRLKEEASAKTQEVIISNQVEGKKLLFPKVQVKQKIKTHCAFPGSSKEDPQKRLIIL